MKFKSVKYPVTNSGEIQHLADDLEAHIENGWSVKHHIDLSVAIIIIYETH